MYVTSAVAWLLLASLMSSSEANRALVRRAIVCLALASFLAIGVPIAHLPLYTQIGSFRTGNWILAAFSMTALGGLVVAVGFVVLSRVFVAPPPAAIVPPSTSSLDPTDWHATAFGSTPGLAYTACRAGLASAHRLRRSDHR